MGCTHEMLKKSKLERIGEWSLYTLKLNVPVNMHLSQMTKLQSYQGNFSVIELLKELSHCSQYMLFKTFKVHKQYQILQNFRTRKKMEEDRILCQSLWVTIMKKKAEHKFLNIYVHIYRHEKEGEQIVSKGEKL